MQTITSDQKQRTILFVDSDKFLTLNIKDQIEQQEIEEKFSTKFLFASDAKTALKKLSSATIDLVILEIVLPVINGYSLLELLKNEYPTVPVVIYTRLKNPQDLAKMATYEVHNIFLKELMKPEDLINIISRQESLKEDIDHVVMELKSQMKAISEGEVGKQLKLVQCPRCNLIIAPDSHYCNNCGQKITQKVKATLRSAKPETKKDEKIVEQTESEGNEKKIEEKNETQITKEETPAAEVSPKSTESIPADPMKNTNQK